MIQNCIDMYGDTYKLHRRNLIIQDCEDAVSIAKEYGYYSAGLYLKGIGYSLEAAIYILFGKG